MNFCSLKTIVSQKNHFQNDQAGRTYLLGESGTRAAEANLS